MPYQIRWIVSQRVLLTTFSGVVTKPELEDYIVQMLTEIPNGKPPLYHVSDSLAMDKVGISLKALTSMVKGLSSFTSLKVQIDINHPRALNTFLASVASQLVKIQSYTVPSLEEAVIMLKRIDSNLELMPWDLPPTTPPAPTPVLATPNTQPESLT